MLDITKKLMELAVEINKVSARSDLVMKQFQVASDNHDKEAMETARIAAHEHLDQLLDFNQKLTELKDQQTKQLIDKLSRNSDK